MFARASLCRGGADSNRRPPAPKPGALPGCATPRGRSVEGRRGGSPLLFCSGRARLRTHEHAARRRPLLGYAMVWIAATLFAVNGTVSKVVLESGISSVELTQVRSAGACRRLGARPARFSARGRCGSLRAELPMLIVFGITGVAFVQWFYFLAIHRLPVGIALLIQYHRAAARRALGALRPARAGPAAHLAGARPGARRPDRDGRGLVRGRSSSTPSASPRRSPRRARTRSTS